MSNDNIIATLTAAIAADKVSVPELRDRISQLLAPIPDGVILCDDSGPVFRIGDPLVMPDEQTRALARRLPAAMERYVTACAQQILDW